MRSEVFQRIQANKKKVYQEMKSFTAERKVEISRSKGKDDQTFTSDYTKLKSPNTTVLSGRIKKIRIPLNVPHFSLGLNRSIRLNNLVPFKIEINVMQRFSEQLSGIKRKLDQTSDQLLYFILVFFGEESMALEMVGIGRKVPLKKPNSLFLSRSLAQIILMNRFQKRHTQVSLSKLFRNLQNVGGMFKKRIQKVLDIISKALNGSYINIKINMSQWILSTFKTSKETFLSTTQSMVKRL